MKLDFSNDLSKIEKFLEEKHYDEAIERSFKVLEKCLEHLFEKAFTKLDIDVQFKIIKKLKDDFSGKKFDDLMIGEKLRIFDNFKILHFLDINLDKQVNPKEFLKLNDLRVKSTHPKKRAEGGKMSYTEITKGNALYCYSVILRFLEKIGYESLISESRDYETSLDSILNFIKENVKSKKPIKIPDYPPIKKKYAKPSGLPDYTHKKIDSFIFKKIAYKPQNWKDLLTKVAEKIYEENKSSFDKIFNLKGRKRTYYTRDPKQQREPRPIGNSGIFVETHFNANHIVKMTLDLLELFGYSREDLKIELS